MDVKTVKIGLSELGFGAGSTVLRTTGLGSCVGLVLYDADKKLSGMAHIMLPHSSLARSREINEAKYADTAIKRLVFGLEEMGSRRKALRAKIAGGAEMFQMVDQAYAMRIGPRNVEAIKSGLKEWEIPLIAEHTGGSKGRTIEFDTDTCELQIRIVHQGELVI